PDRNATSATSTSGSPSARQPRPPRSTPSTPAAKHASPSPPASSTSSTPTSPSRSPSHSPTKAIGFDRKMPDVDFDSLELPPTGTLPLGVPGAGREGGARNRQQPRRSKRQSAQPSVEVE